jgi:hypothetical protein
MEVAASRNPNICAGCAQLLEDDSPVTAARAQEESVVLSESTLVASTGDRSSADGGDSRVPPFSQP